MSDIHNLDYLKTRRKELRGNLTMAEARLWKYLQKSQLDGRKFRRQHSIGNYILDFYCTSEKLAVELDGGQHYEETTQSYDETRTEFLNKLGIRVIRFTNTMVLGNIEWLLDEIRVNFTEVNKPPLAPT